MAKKPSKKLMDEDVRQYVPAYAPPKVRRTRQALDGASDAITIPSAVITSVNANGTPQKGKQVISPNARRLATANRGSGMVAPYYTGNTPPAWVYQGGNPVSTTQQGTFYGDGQFVPRRLSLYEQMNRSIGNPIFGITLP